jgi:RNA polymerase sigma-70 factor (ECF subfamily)
MADGAHDEANTDEALALLYARDPNSVQGREALATLVERWSGRVYLWAYRNVREREQALDIAQDCLVRMIGALRRYESRGRFRAWLFTIVLNRCRSVQGRSRWQVDPDLDPDTLFDGTPGPERAHESAEWERRLDEAFHAVLDEREQLAFWLRAEEGMKVEDITRLMRLESASGARGLLQNARRKLRLALAEWKRGGGDA